MIATPSFNIGGMTFTKKSDEKLMAHYMQFCSARDASERERGREFENLRMYAGVDNSQWPGQLQSFMLGEGRGTAFGSATGTQYGNSSKNSGFIHLGQYNLVKFKLNGIAGSLVRNPFDASYVADESEQADLTLALQEAYNSDKELMDWSNALMSAYIQSMIYQAVIRIYPSNEHPASPMGNIAIECYPPGTNIIDPEWKNGRTSDINDIFTLTWLNANQIKEKYKVKKDILENELRLQKMFGKSYEADGLDWNKDIPETHGDKFLVVEHSYLKKEKISREIDTYTGTVFWEWLSDEQKMAMAQENNVDPTNITKIDLWDDVSYTYTMAPGLSTNVALLDTKDEFQCGRLKKIPLSSEWQNGKPLPLLDQVRDCQLEINKRIATVSHAAESSITAGAYVDEAVFGMDNGKIEEMIANRRNPNYVARLKAGASRAFPNGIGELPKGQVPPDLFNITNMMIDLMDRLVPQPAATEGRTERSGESGILFAQKVEVAKTMQMTLLEQIRQFQNAIGEVYFFMAKQLYGEGRRVFADAKGQRRVIVNDTRINPMTGEEETINDFSALSRHKVVISEAPSGVNNRLMQRELSATLMQSFQGLPSIAIQMGKNLIKSLDLDSMQKQDAIDAITLEEERIRAQTELAIVNAQMAIQQAKQMMSGAGGPGQAPEAAGGGAMPGEQAVLEPEGGGSAEQFAPQQSEPELVGDLAQYEQLRGGGGA